MLYQVTENGHPFVKLSGLGINANAYNYENSLLKIKHDYLINFTDGGTYSLSAHFDGFVLPLEFHVQMENEEYQIVNGGFETGDLTGWTPSPIWKDESGLSSFRNERIVNTAYYGSGNANLYNRDGSYHLGVYVYPYDNANKDLNQERMGKLRSTDFILGGSGWISFKLGGGRNTGVAYLSVKDAENDEEIARYGNNNFNNTELSHTSNAEAFMFPYYADLSSFLGRNLYLELNEGASHEWSVLSADSFITYYASSPASSSGFIAADIRPNVTHAGENLNNISNTLASDVSDWNDPQGIFRWEGGQARTNKVGGDGALGVVRSPAFSIGSGPNKYVTWEWEGNIALDKQLFVYVKETKTNRTMALLNRRDNRSTKSGGGMDRHWYNLSDLDPAKEYYLEFVDNTTAGWGLVSIRNVELVSAVSSKVSVGSDVAVNAYYGPVTVNRTTGSHRTPFDRSGLSVYEIISTLGEDPSSQAGIRYRSESQYSFVRLYDGENELQITPDHVYANGEYINRVYMDGLSENTRYRYSVNVGSNETVLRSFMTLSDDSGSFSFVFSADTQANTWQEAGVSDRLYRKALETDADARFILHTGDVVETGENLKMWNWFFERNSVLKDTPVYPITGNHDYYDEPHQFVSEAAFTSHFALPKTQASSPNASYYFKTHDTLFIMLDAIIQEDWETTSYWLINTVINNPTGKIIVSTHYSAYGGYHSGMSTSFRNYFGPIFDTLNVDLVLSGHDHVLTRTVPIGTSGTVYLSGGSASAKIYSLQTGYAEYYAYYLTQQINAINLITVNQGNIQLKTIDVSGNILDQSVITV